tara:strand:- start:151 stop:1029 length:879 start_codon:yes stop_codon:yes gene_type:complete
MFLNYSMTNNYLNTKQVADLFKVDNSTIRRWTLSEKLKCTSSNGGHRKFSYRNILDFIENHNKKLNLDLKQISNEKNVSLSERKKYITQNALDRNSIEIQSIIMKLYLEGKKVHEIFDKYIDPSLDAIQTLLDKESISVAEEHIARKTISKSLNNFRDVVKKSEDENKTALCLNLENDVPDLAIDMIQIILEGQNYSVHNAGSNTSIENIKLLLNKNNFDSIFIYMCSRQCCTATVRDHIDNTLKSLKLIESLCEDSSIKLYIGGPATSIIDSNMNLNYTQFSEFSDILDLI